MKDFILYLWQLPQNILGLLVILFTRAEFSLTHNVWETRKYSFGVSLGRYIIFGKHFEYTDLKHEKGHQKQSLYLGPLYLLLIGIPSMSGNLWDRLFHRKWAPEKREKWYYNLIWEAWADKLGHVRRFVKGGKNA